jgi:hypothetical protein
MLAVNTHVNDNSQINTDNDDRCKEIQLQLNEIQKFFPCKNLRVEPYNNTYRIKWDNDLNLNPFTVNYVSDNNISCSYETFYKDLIQNWAVILNEDEYIKWFKKNMIMRNCGNIELIYHLIYMGNAKICNALIGFITDEHTTYRTVKRYCYGCYGMCSRYDGAYDYHPIAFAIKSYHEYMNKNKPMYFLENVKHNIDYLSIIKHLISIKYMDMNNYDLQQHKCCNKTPARRIPEPPPTHERTPQYLAVKYGYFDIFVELYKNGANMNAIPIFESPIRDQVIQFLLEQKNNVDLKE